VLSGDDWSHPLDAFRAAASYGFDQTITPSIQYFRAGSGANAIHFGWAGSRPNTAGVIAQVAYLPWARSESPVQSLNLRFAAQYVAYTENSGNAHAPAGNNALYLSLWGTLHF
jgi:hypothetical protein